MATKNPFIGPEHFVEMDKEEIDKKIDGPLTPETAKFSDARNYSPAEWMDISYPRRKRIKKYTSGLFIDKYGAPRNSYEKKHPDKWSPIKRALEFLFKKFEDEHNEEYGVEYDFEDADEIEDILNYGELESDFLAEWRFSPTDIIVYAIQRSHNPMEELPDALNVFLLDGNPSWESLEWPEIYLTNSLLDSEAEKALQRANEVAKEVTDPPDELVEQGAQDDFRGGVFDDDDLRERFEQMFSDTLDEWVEEIEEEFPDEGLGKDAVLDALGPILQDTDMYEDWRVDDSGMVMGYFFPGGFNLSEAEIRDIEREMYHYSLLATQAVWEYGPEGYRDDIIRAIESGSGVDVPYDGDPFIASADPDLDKVKEELWESLGLDEENKAERGHLVASGPIEERIVCRSNHPDFPNVYVVDLRPDELQDEGRGAPEEEGTDADGQRGLSHCIGHEHYGHPRVIRKGLAKAFSVRRPPSKRKGMRMFTIEASIDADGNVTEIREVKGLANRIPGYEIVGKHQRFGAKTRPKKKLGEVDLLVHLLQECFGIDPTGVGDMQPGLRLLAEKQRADKEKRKKNPAGETILYDYTDLDLDVAEPTKTVCGPWRG